MSRSLFAGVLLASCARQEPLIHDRLPTAPPVAVAVWRPDSLASVVASRAPFQITRRPLPPVSVLSGSPAPTGRPELTLAGLSIGARSLAVLEGLPGTTEPVVLAEGDTARGVTVRRITAAGVTLSGFGSTWTLALTQAP